MESYQMIVNGRYAIRKLYLREVKGHKVYYGCFFDTDEKRLHRFSTRTGNEKQAIKVLQQYVAHFHEKATARPKLSLQDAIKQYLETRLLRPGSIESYRQTLEPFSECFPAVQLASIGQLDVERYLKSLHEKGNGAHTVSKRLADLKAFFSWAAGCRFIEYSPAASIRSPKVPRKAYRTLTADEARKLLAACRTAYKTPTSDWRGTWQQSSMPPDHLFLACLLGLSTGLRYRTITGLTWRHVDLQNRTINLPGSLMKAGHDFSTAIPDELFYCLQERYKRETDDPSSGGQAVEERNLVPVRKFTKAFKSALERAGLPALSFHVATRHTFSTWLQGSITFPVLKALLGHTREITLDYTHVDIDTKRAALKNLPQLL